MDEYGVLEGVYPSRLYERFVDGMIGYKIVP